MMTLVVGNLFGQARVLDSLRDRLATAHDGKERVIALSGLADYYGFNQFDSCQFYAKQVLEQSDLEGFTYGKFLGTRSLFFALNTQGNYPKALEVVVKGLEAVKGISNDHPDALIIPHYFLGVLYREMGDLPAAKNELHQAMDMQRASGESMSELFFAYSQMAMVCSAGQERDSALWYARKGYEYGLNSKKFQKFLALAMAVLGNTEERDGHLGSAKVLYSGGMAQSRIFGNVYFEARNAYLLASLYAKEGNADSCINLARYSCILADQHEFSEYKENAAKLLAEQYRTLGRADSSLFYMTQMIVARDSVFSQAKIKQFQKTVFEQERSRQQVKLEEERSTYQKRLLGLLAICGVAFLFGGILFRNNRQKEKANAEVRKAYRELKSTQAQLIQSEKMASLGELTAGIAHEIQNPLNFVNNFSDINKELVEEAMDSLVKGDLEDLSEILTGIGQNQDKISHHGRRADAIVKSMLQHSRTSSGQKAPTDLATLADEYLKLAFHGMRAKDKDFNCILETDFEPDLPKVNVVPQDIGRVLLNLYNNAFQAVMERKKTGEEGYEPKVRVEIRGVSGQHAALSSQGAGGQAGKQSTAVNSEFGIRNPEWARIAVSDNGFGVPDAIRAKIFQPFFTTRPAGQGMGLGLSLSYDIVKAHQGALSVESKKGEFTEFKIELPVKGV